MAGRTMLCELILEVMRVVCHWGSESEPFLSVSGRWAVRLKSSFVKSMVLVLCAEWLLKQGVWFVSVL